MIPKIIHYCWFGGKPLPPLALSCINSWKKFFPDYEIKEWNEKNFDVNQIKYTKEAYKQKKYAYVSDYARFKILKEYGGIYFDTDVEIIRSFKDIIDNGNFFGFEVDPDGKNTPGIYAPKYCFAVNPGLGFGFEKNHPFLNDIIKKCCTNRMKCAANGCMSYNEQQSIPAFSVRDRWCVCGRWLSGVR